MKLKVGNHVCCIGSKSIYECKKTIESALFLLIEWCKDTNTTITGVRIETEELNDEFLVFIDGTREIESPELVEAIPFKLND